MEQTTWREWPLTDKVLRLGVCLDKVWYMTWEKKKKVIKNLTEFVWTFLELTVVFYGRNRFWNNTYLLKYFLIRFPLSFNASQVKWNILITKFLKQLSSILFIKNSEYKMSMICATLGDIITQALRWYSYLV